MHAASNIFQGMLTPVLGATTSLAATLTGFFQTYNPVLQGLSFIIAIATGVATLVHVLRKKHK